MRIFLCEKPSVAKTIAEFLGRYLKRDGFFETDGGDVITWAYGHLLKMADPEDYDPILKKWSLDHLPYVPEKWLMKINPSTSKQFKVIRKLLSKKSVEVVLATDIGREGEVIGRELLEYCDFKGKVSRLWLTSMEDSSVRKALDSLRPGESTYLSYIEGLARARADWLVGINLTRIATLQAQKGGFQGVVSIGRIQSPALFFIVERDRTIAEFIPKPYYELQCVFCTESGNKIEAVFKADSDFLDEDSHCFDRSYLETVADKVSKGGAFIKKIDTKRSKEQAPLPLSLSALQTSASEKWGYSAQEVLDTAQALYEKKATTYPRVDSRYLPEAQHSEAESIIESLLTGMPQFEPIRKRLDLSVKSRAWNDKKLGEHHAIIPTIMIVDSSKLSSIESNIYQLIVRHYLAQFFDRYEYDSTQISIQVSSAYDFLAKGIRVVQPGWKVLFGTNDNVKEQELPINVNEGCSLVVRESSVLSKKTSPPKHYTDGTWIGAMVNAARFIEDPRLKKLLSESAGLGTEATRASVLETLIKRNFVTRRGKYLVATPVGSALVDALPPILKNPGFSALWEQALGEISKGDLSLDLFMQRQVIALNKLVSDLSVERLPLTSQKNEQKGLKKGGGSRKPSRLR